MMACQLRYILLQFVDIPSVSLSDFIIIRHYSQTKDHVLFGMGKDNKWVMTRETNEGGHN